jgi:SAM-dependent methyltransferase
VSREKEWVKQRYGAIASQATPSCCPDAASQAQQPCCAEAAAQAQQPCCADAAPCCPGQPTIAEQIGYSPEDLATLPEAAGATLGCGNPLALASITPGETILDLGSGAGFDAFLAARRVGPTGRVIGVDLTPEMIEQARANAERAGCTNVEFRLGDIETLPLEDASVDLVISNCVLVLVPDKAKAFAEIARVLKPGGRVAIADIILDGPLPEALEGDADAYCSCVSGAVGRAEYLAALTAAGLDDVHIAAEADASELLAGDCCSTGVTAADLRGVVTSVHIAGRKPAHTGDPS